MYNEAIWLVTYRRTDKTDENGDPVLEEVRTGLIFARKFHRTVGILSGADKRV